MRRITEWAEIRGGDVGFHVGRGFVSQAIEALTERHDLQGLQTPSHAALVLSRSEVIEALDKTVVRALACYQQRFGEGLFYVYRPDLSDDVRREALAWVAREYRGAAYGWLQIPAFLPVLGLRRLFGRDLPNLMPVGTICSELVLLYLRKAHELLVCTQDVARANYLRWVWAVGQDTTDPALQLACCQRDAVPLYLAGSAPLVLGN